MKRLIISLMLASAVLVATAQDRPDIKDCTVTKQYGMMTETFPLYGNVKILTARDKGVISTFDVKVVKSPGAAAVYVQRVDRNPVRCGEWRFVDDAKKADFTVRFVESSEDFTICFVTGSPGSRY